MEVMQKIFNWAEGRKALGGRANVNEHLRKTYECEAVEEGEWCFGTCDHMLPLF
jgi:hypothetical protein